MLEKKKYIIWEEGEYHHPNSCGFVPNIMAYLHNEEREATYTYPAIIIVPGGGYASVSPTEGEIVAKRFYEKGYQAFVLTYTINRLMGTPIKMQALRDISRAIRYIRSQAKQFCIDSNRVAVCGFSAGGHLCASLCVHFLDIVEENTEAGKKYVKHSNRPDAAILSYPVITSGSYAHRDSFRALLGRDIYKNMSEPYEGIPGCKTKAEALDYMSLEKHITKDTPPCFLWHTVTDELVPMENSLMFMRELRREKIPVGYHLFSSGDHGMSLANEIWAKGFFGEDYTHEQTNLLLLAILSGEISLDEEEKEEYEAFCEYQREHPNWIEGEKNPEVEQWFDMAIEWLSKNMT